MFLLFRDSIYVTSHQIHINAPTHSVNVMCTRIIMYILHNMYVVMYECMNTKGKNVNTTISDKNLYTVNISITFKLNRFISAYTYVSLYIHSNTITYVRYSVPLASVETKTFYS